MHFADEADITVSAGNGGNGSASFRREKFIAKGGPDGGNGGNGGSIIFETDPNLNTLVNFMSRKHYRAVHGEIGHGNNRYGKHGEDKILKVPVGTLIYEGETLLADLKEEGQHFVAARGGMGGKGNANFTTSVRQAPDFAELGEPGEERELHLELKLIAEVAIIGLPSAGKSTLISRISNARPKIADYPFTTLVPNLGVVQVDGVDFLVADIPGLIEGAHEGKGLGIAFLKHIERARLLVHLVDITRDHLKEDYQTLNKELKSYSAELAKKPQILVFSKTDATIPEITEECKKDFAKEKPLFVSAVSGEGMDAFLYKLKDQVLALRTKKPAKAPQKPKIFRPHLENEDIKNYRIEKTEEGFRVSGKRIEQLAVMTDMGKKGAIYRMQDILEKIGATRQMKKEGGKQGHKIFIGERVFDFME